MIQRFKQVSFFYIHKIENFGENIDENIDKLLFFIHHESKGSMLNCSFTYCQQ